MNKVRIGIIGIGNMGSAHSKSILDGNIPRMELGAVCDIEPAKLSWAKENLPGVPQFQQYEDLLGSGLVDAVLIATPHYLHPVIAVKAFQKGLHVLTEKPAGVYTAQVEEIHRGLWDFAQEWVDLEQRLGLCLPISGRDAYGPMLEVFGGKNAPYRRGLEGLFDEPGIG